jgi:hypothetical protein
MEFGPRALGGRSIIGDPRSPKMQSVMNLKIKYRESFRPFAPAVLAEQVSDWFEYDGASPYMLMVAPVAESRRLPMTDAQQRLFGIDRSTCRALRCRPSRTWTIRHGCRPCTGDQSALSSADRGLRGTHRLPAAGQHLVQRPRRAHRRQPRGRLPLLHAHRDGLSGAGELPAAKSEQPAVERTMPGSKNSSWIEGPDMMHEHPGTRRQGPAAVRADHRRHRRRAVRPAAALAAGARLSDLALGAGCRAQCLGPGGTGDSEARLPGLDALRPAREPHHDAHHSRHRLLRRDHADGTGDAPVRARPDAPQARRDVASAQVPQVAAAVAPGADDAEPNQSMRSHRGAATRTLRNNQNQHLRWPERRTRDLRSEDRRG